jgi:hypothetical protein
LPAAPALARSVPVGRIAGLTWSGKDVQWLEECCGRRGRCHLAGPQEAASRRKITMKNLWQFYAYAFLAVTGLEVWRPALLLAAAVAGTAMLRSLRRRQAAVS